MTLTVFLKNEIIARGDTGQVAGAVQSLPELARSSDLLAFDDDTGKQVDIDLSGATAPAPRKRGRPALGVTAKEVTLLPRHWDWLAKQRGGASAELRRLVENALRSGRSQRECQDAAFAFLNVIAGDLPDFEEAIRAIYANDMEGYDRKAAEWPVAIRDHGRALAFPE